MFALGKVAVAFRKALDETGHANVTLAAGSWRFDFLPSADVFMPPKVTLIPLDYNYELTTDPTQETLRKIGRDRPVVPIIWAQHDDREFAGRSYVPFSGLASLLRWSNSAGYGVIHWTTRPLDLYFKSVASQVWTASETETLETTASEMAKRTFGAGPQEEGKRYLLSWIYDAPAFGRETTDKFIDQFLDLDNETKGVKSRLELLSRMQALTHDVSALEWIRYFQGWEQFALGFYKSQSALQRSLSASAAGNVTLARSEIATASPESVLQQYSHTIQSISVSRGEKGILISMNLRWLPYFVAQRQAVGLEPLRIMFAPTFPEKLAQSPGNYTFAFDAGGHLIEVLGSSEVGANVQAQRTGTGCSGGLEVDHPLKLSIGGLAGTSLPSGVYRLRLDRAPADHIKVETTDRHETVKSTPDRAVTASAGRVDFTVSPVAGFSSICGLILQLGASEMNGAEF
jgi:hypothetical protein